MHDLTDGLYFTDSAQAAQGYADLRAGEAGGGNVLEVTLERRSLGKVLDLPAMPAWERFLAGKPPVASMGRTWREYMARGTEPYNGGFRTFLHQQKLRLADYDAIVAEDLIRNPGARQLVIVNEKVAERIDDRLVRVTVSGTKPPATPHTPSGGVPDEPTVVAERVGEDAAADLAEKAAGTAAEGLTFSETVGAAFESISPVLDVLFLAQAGFALGKALIFHNPAEMDPDEVKLMQLMDTNVMPAAFKALQAHEQEARELAQRHPERDVYASVTMTITYGADGAVSMGKNPTMVYDDEHLEDAQFNTVSVGYDSSTAKKDGGETHHYADWKDHRRRMQLITFPILLNPLGRSRAERRWDAMVAIASRAIARGLSARSIAEGTYWVGKDMGPGGYNWTYLDDREEARRKKTLAPSHRAEVELAAKVAFTYAYLFVASFDADKPPVKKLYDDAVQYYDELKRTTIDPTFGPVTKPPPQPQGFRLPVKTSWPPP